MLSLRLSKYIEQYSRLYNKLLFFKPASNFIFIKNTHKPRFFKPAFNFKLNIHTPSYHDAHTIYYYNADTTHQPNNRTT